MSKTPKSSAAPSSNWVALAKSLGKNPLKPKTSAEQPRKRRKLSHDSEELMFSRAPRVEQPVEDPTRGDGSESIVNGESLPALRQMVLGKTEFSEGQRQPGKFLAMDCEMVGVGPEGAESSLARVSLVNFYGAVVLDVFVRQRERVVDYRTHVSGVREKDMIGARPFEEVQKQVSELLKDKILVGHAVHNDMQALLLSHPRGSTRDTQFFAGKLKLTRSTRIALRALVQQELGMTIQAGEHSSVTDARATMAVFRLHRREWEAWAAAQGRKRKRHEKRSEQRTTGEGDEEDDVDDVEDAARPTKSKPNRTGISSGLSTVVRHSGGEREVRRGAGGGGARTKAGGGGTTTKDGGAKTQWWKQLGSTGTVKGSMRVG